MKTTKRINSQNFTWARNPHLTSSGLQRKCACGKSTVGQGECAECNRKRQRLQRRAMNEHIPQTAPLIVSEVLREPGRPLSEGTRNFMESRFGWDFSQVRIHTGAKAAESAQAVNALAYTAGPNVVFNANQFSPGTDNGKSLLAHELAHVVQQKDLSLTNNAAIPIDHANTASEREASQTAKNIITNTPVVPETTLSSPRLQRQDAPIDRRNRIEPDIDLGLDHINTSLNILSGRYRISLGGGLQDPANLLPFFSDPARLRAVLEVGNDCNEAFQNALISVQRDITGDEENLDIGGGTSIRLGSQRVTLGGTLGFNSEGFRSFMITLSSREVSERVPERCRISPPAPPSRSEEPPGDRDRQRGGEEDSERDRGGGGGETPPAPSPLPALTIHFFYDSTIRRPESNDNFQMIARTLQRYSPLHVYLGGHASLEGTERYNLQLSQRRAEAIRDDLIRLDIDASRIHISWYGESAPVAAEPPIDQYIPSPSLERVRNQNRRVEARFFDPSGQLRDLETPLRLETGNLQLPPNSPSLLDTELRL